MTRVITPGVVLIEGEPEGKCELCGAIAELRPYGPNGERICFKCGMAHIETTNAAFEKLLKK